MLYKTAFFLLNLPLFSSGSGSFLAPSAARHAWGSGPRVHCGASLGPGRAPRRVLRASCEQASSRGVLSARPKPGRPPRKPQNAGKTYKFRLCCSEPVSAVIRKSTTPALKSCVRPRSRSKTVIALQAFPFVTAMNDASAVAYECVRV